MQDELVQIQEIIAVDDGDLLCSSIIVGEFHILINVLGDIQLRRPKTSGSDNTVIQTRRHVVLVRTWEVVACQQLIKAIHPRPVTRVPEGDIFHFGRIEDCLVHPVPDAGAKTCRRTVDEIPEFLHITQSGTFGVNVFADEVRLVAVDVLADRVHRGIHAGIDVTNIIKRLVSAVSFVVYQTIVQLANGIVCSLYVGTNTALIT